MKSVLISIQPKWCSLIAQGKKTVEVRKTRPKFETPFKCYIYCTLQGSNEFFRNTLNGSISEWNKGNWGFKKGKVIGEFVCDGIFVDNMYGHNKRFYDMACMRETDIAWYCCQSPMYGWHISDLVIYDQPKELSEFNAICPYKKTDGTRKPVECPCDKYTWDYDEKTGKSFCTRRITRPPQSWCYVEERENNAPNL